MKAIWHPLDEQPAVPCSAIIRLTPVPGTGGGDDAPLLMPCLARWCIKSGVWLNEFTDTPYNLAKPNNIYHWALEDDLVALT